MDISKELSELLGFYSLLVGDDVGLHKDLISLYEKAGQEGYEEAQDEFVAFKDDPFNEDLELCERIGNKHAAQLFKDCVTLEDFKEVMREVEIQNCRAMPIPAKYTV